MGQFLNNRLIITRKEGFFSLFFQVLGHLALSEARGQIPLVYFNRKCNYWSDSGWHSVRNAWEYYFEPVSTLAIEDLLPIGVGDYEGFGNDDFRAAFEGVGVEVACDYPDVIHFVWPDDIERQRTYVNHLICKYIRIKPHIMQRVEFLANVLFQAQPVIGVHYRGREKMTDGTSISRLTYENYYSEIEKQLRKFPGGKVFVATDSADFLSALMQRYGEVVVCSESLRLSREDEHVGLHFHPMFRGPLAGEEVLIDALLLARSSVLLHGMSNVATAALHFNPRLTHLNLEWKLAVGQRFCRSTSRLVRPLMPTRIRRYLWQFYLRRFK